MADRLVRTIGWYLERIDDCAAEIARAQECGDVAWVEVQQRRRAWLKQKMRDRYPLASKETVKRFGDD